jgi:hypothetical protein
VLVATASRAMAWGVAQPATGNGAAAVEFGAISDGVVAAAASVLEVCEEAEVRDALAVSQPAAEALDTFADAWDDYRFSARWESARFGYFDSQLGPSATPPHHSRERQPVC